MRARSGFPLLAFALVAACDGGPAAPRDPVAGTYDWVASTGGFAATTRTPDTEGYTVGLILDGRGSVVVTVDGRLHAAGRYTVRTLPSNGPLPVYEIHWSPTLDVFPFAAFERHTLTRAEPGQVRFTDPCCDGWSHTFRAF